MQKLDRLLSSPRPQSATYLGASSTQNSEISTSYPSPTLAFAERGSSTMFHARVYRRYNTVYQGTWPSKRILSASIGISGPVFLRENRGDRVHEGQTSKAILTPRGFSGLMEMRARRMRSRRRKSKKSCPLPPLLLFKDHPSPSSRLGLFFWSPAGGYGFNNWGGNRGRNRKRFLRSLPSYRGDFFSFFFFFGDISLELGFCCIGFSWLVRM